MSDLFGNTSLPLTSAATPGVIVLPTQDPFITYLLSYLQTNANARLTTSWSALVPNSSPIVSANPWEPEVGTFNERSLPALFAWRQSWPVFQRLASEWFLGKSQISMLWVLPTAVQYNRQYRQTFFGDLLKLFDTVIEVGREMGEH